MTLVRVARAECRRCWDFPKKALLGKLTHLERCALLPFSGLDPENRQVGGSSRCDPVSLKKEKQKESLGPEAATPAPGSDFSFMRELLPNTHIFKPQPLGHGWHEWISTLGSSLSFQLLYHLFLSPNSRSYQAIMYFWFLSRFTGVPDLTISIFYSSQRGFTIKSDYSFHPGFQHS